MTTIAEEDVPSHSSLLTPGQMTQEIVEGPPSSSDDPYQKNDSRHPQPLRKGIAIPPPGTDTAMKGYPSTVEADGLHLRQGSMSSLHLSLHMADNSVNNRVLLKDPLEESRSDLSDHELLRSHSRQQGHIDDTYSVTSSGGSLARSIAGSESRQAAYRIHKGPVNSRPNPDIGHRVHYVAPPGSDERPDSEVVILSEGPPIAGMVAKDVRRYERCKPR
jgi:hypothetical protein